MRAELNDTYETFSRLDNPPLFASGAAPARWLLPGGLRARGRCRRGRAAPARGRRRGDQADVRPPGGALRGVATALLVALEDDARSLGYSLARLDTGPKQVHTLALYRSVGYVEVAPYNDNPFACFWGEKVPHSVLTLS